MIQVTDAQIRKIRQQISRQVAFPEEMSSTFDEKLAHEFLDDVIRCQTDEDLQSFTTLLPRKRLNDLFGALLVMSAAAGESVVLRLLEILRLRITPSLAETGWAFYQHHYPNDRMSRVLSTVVRELTDKYADMPYLQLIAQVSDLPVIDDNLPERIAQRLLQQPDENIADFLVKMMIMPDSPFAASLLTAYFSTCPDDSILANSDLFVHAIKINAESEQVNLVGRYFAEQRIKADWAPVNAALLEMFGPPRTRQQQKLASLLGRSSDSRLWDHLPIEAVDRFRQWYMIDILNRHITDNQRKKVFYQKYQSQILDLSNWDDKTLVVHFEKFVLADHEDDADLIYYYDLNTYQIMSDGNHFEVKLNKPSGKVITARQAQLSGEKINIVCLQLDQVNLLYSRDFIAERLSSTSQDMLN